MGCLVASVVDFEDVDVLESLAGFKSLLRLNVVDTLCVEEISDPDLASFSDGILDLAIDMVECFVIRVRLSGNGIWNMRGGGSLSPRRRIRLLGEVRQQGHIRLQGRAGVEVMKI